MCKNCDYASGPDNPSEQDPMDRMDYCAGCGLPRRWHGEEQCWSCGSTSTVAVPSDV